MFSHDSDRQPQPDELRRLDLLVDGELSDAERRELLAGLDRQPDGWRRCALAFLEAQSWRTAFGSLSQESEDRESRSEASPASMPVHSKLRRVTWFGSPLALAASLFIAFGLGLVLQDGLFHSNPDHNPTHVQRPGWPAESQIAESSPEAPAAQAVRLTWNDDARGAQQIDLPVVEPQELERSWQRGAAEFLSPELVDLLGRMGHRVEHEREMIPVELQDGRHVRVPVDRMRVHYVGDQYQ